MAPLLCSPPKPRRGVRRPHLPYHSHLLPAQPLTYPHFCPHNHQATVPIPECFAASTTISLHPTPTPPRPNSWHSKAARHSCASCPPHRMLLPGADPTALHQQFQAGDRKIHLFSFNHRYLGAIWASRALLFALPRI